MTPKEIEVVKAYNREYNKDWNERNLEKVKASVTRYQKNYYDKLKLDALNAYGGPICIICGKTDIDKLSIDHSFKDGKEHRQELFGDSRICGWRFYLWLRNNDYPQDLGFRVLCMFCNTKEGPHPLKGPRKMGLFRDYDWLCNRYVTDNRTLHEIGEECGVSYVTILNQLVSFDISRRDGPRGGPYKTGPFRDYNWLYKRYILDKKSVTEIAKESGVSYITIYRQLVSFDIPRGEAKN